MKTLSSLTPINIQSDLDGAFQCIGDMVDAFMNNYTNAKNEMQYEALFTYCKTNLKYKGEIKGLIKFLKKQNIQRKIKIDDWSGYEYYVYAINNIVAITCTHYLRYDTTFGLIEKHSIVITSKN